MSRATKLISRIFKILKISKNVKKMPNFFSFRNSFLPNHDFQKTVKNVLEGVNVSWICVQNFKSISSKMAEI